MADEPLLDVVDLRKEFGSHVAVDDVSFQIAEGGSLAIVGESGSGKTTIAKMITGLLAPTSGSIRACGHDRSRPAKGAAERRRRGGEVQIVFQDPYSSLDPRQSGAAAIDEVLALHRGGTREERDRRVAELGELVGVERAGGGVGHNGQDIGSTHRHPEVMPGPATTGTPIANGPTP
jgi:ABC-type glutathione transport system ATPase component